MWHYTFPFFGIFLIGSKHGALATLFLFFPVFTNVIYDALTPGTGYYSSQFSIRYLPSVSVALVFAYLFERERERFRRQTLTAYREQERIIKERTDQLVARIAERDRMAEKLRRSQKMEAIGTMAGGVAHDLNNILSGFETYRRMIEFNPEQKAIIVSGYSTSEEVHRTMELGAFAIIKKPYSIGELSGAVKKCLDLNPNIS